MKRLGAVGMAVLLTGMTAGCNTLSRQPRLDNAGISPASLKPGDIAVITVRVVDKHKIVQRVVGVVKEDPRMKFKLRDDDKAPDEKPLDGVWSLQVDVPFMAPPGQFTLELTGYDSKGEAIIVKTARHETGPLSAVCTLVIEYPPESDESAPPAPAGS